MNYAMHPGPACLALSIFMVAQSPALADDGATVRFTVTVPLTCDAETVSTRTTGTGATLVVDERCNGPDGYDLYLQHSGDVSVIRYDGVRILPDPGGRTLLAAVPHARDHRSRIEIAAGREAGQIFLVLSPNT